MRLRNVKGAKDIIENSNYVIHNYQDYFGRFKKIFGNDKRDRFSIWETHKHLHTHTHSHIY